MKLKNLSEIFRSVNLIILTMILSWSFPLYSQAISRQINIPSEINEATKLFKKSSIFVFSPVKKNSIINYDNTKYANEVFYYFNKVGFRNSPISGLLFESGEVIIPNFQPNSDRFSSNLGSGVVWFLMIYDTEFDISKFNDSLKQFIQIYYPSLIKYTDIKKGSDFLLKNFKVEITDTSIVVRYFDYENSYNYIDRLRETISLEVPVTELDTEKDTELKFKIEKIVQPPEGLEPSSVSEVLITIKNISKNDIFFGDNSKLQVKFKDDSIFFVNNIWQNSKTALSIDSGLLRAGETMDLKIPVLSGILPDKYIEEFYLEYQNDNDSFSKIIVMTGDYGQKVIRTKIGNYRYISAKSSPSNNANEIARIKPGSLFIYTEKSGDYYKINITSSQIGWIYKGSVDVVKAK